MYLMNFKMKRNIPILLIVLLAFIVSCDEEPVGQQPMDNTPPGPVTNIQVKNISGGAVFRYDLPDDEDLLYVKALYKINEVETETISSVYADSLVILGFGDTEEHEVALVAVDRSRNKSTPEKVTIKPLTPDVLIIGESLSLMEDFGGLQANWENPNKADVSVNILYKDHNDEFVPLETFYSSSQIGKGAVRGMDTLTMDFAIYVQDRWENQSAPKYYTLTPIYETEFEKNKFSKVRLPGDIAEYPGYGIERIWDNNNNGDPCFSSPGGTGIWPQYITMDMGVTAKISRIRLYQRTGLPAYIFAEGNPREFEVWGCETLDTTGDWDSWVKLMDCVSVKPSGLPIGQNSDDDLDVAYNGEDFSNSPENPAVRYLRILVKRTWMGGDNFQIAEIDIFGDNR